MPKAERDVAINKIRESLHQLQRDPNSVFFSERYAKTPTGNSKVPNLKSKLRKWMSMENLNAKADDKLDSAIQNMGGNSDISKHRRRHSERAGAVESHDDETSSVRSSRSHVKKKQTTDQESGKRARCLKCSPFRQNKRGTRNCETS